MIGGSSQLHLSDGAASRTTPFGVSCISVTAAWASSSPESALATRFFSAVKTGTSKEMRDNWCVGFSERYTVGVWVGNASGAPMHDVSGVTGAAPAEHLEDALAAQVALPGRRRADEVGLIGREHVLGVRVRFGVDGRRLHAEPARGADHPGGDLATVGDQNLGEGGHRRAPALRSPDAIRGNRH